MTSSELTLLPAGAKGGGGDTAAMVQARADFLAAGHFAGLAADLAQAAGAAAGSVAASGCVVDVGAGTGYYLAAVLDRLPGRVGQLHFWVRTVRTLSGQRQETGW